MPSSLFVFRVPCVPCVPWFFMPPACAPRPRRGPPTFAGSDARRSTGTRCVAPPGAGRAAGRIEELRQARRQPFVVVRVVDDVALLRRVQQFAGAVVARRDDRQAARHRLQHHVGARVVKGRMDEEVGREVGVAHVAAIAAEADAVGHAEPLGQPLPFRRLRTADHQQQERPIAPDAPNRMQQRRQPLEAIVHAREQGHGVVRRRAPLLAPLDPAPRPVAGLEPFGVGRQTNQAKIVRVHAEIELEMATHHLANGDDQRPRPRQVLAPFQRQERQMGRIEGLAEPKDLTQQSAAVLEQVVFRRGDVETALRIKHVQAGQLVEADRDLARTGGQRAAAGGGEEPRPQKTRAGRQDDRVIVRAGRQRRGVPAAGVDVDLVAVQSQAAGEAGNVGFAAPAAGQNAIVAERDVHDDVPPPAGAFPWFRSRILNASRAFWRVLWRR